MTLKRWLILARSTFVALVATAIVVQFASSSKKSNFDAVNFFSFFTMQSNIIASVVFLITAARWRSVGSPTLDLLRGAAVVYMVTTGIIYALLLADLTEELQVTVPWVDTVLHEVMPLAVLIDWLLDPPASPLSVRRTLWWLAFPVVWLVYSLVRGAVVGWYPYPFLDPATGGGVTGVTIATISIGVFVTLLVVGVTTVGDRLRVRADRAMITR
ncbi:MAG: Pr6Pr family membrane protein [Actinomycetota bacterium]